MDYIRNLEPLTDVIIPELNAYWVPETTRQRDVQKSEGLEWLIK
jgi:hypothetical protein